MFNFLNVLHVWASRLRGIGNNWNDVNSVCVEFRFNRALYSKVFLNLGRGHSWLLLIFDDSWNSRLGCNLILNHALFALCNVQRIHPEDRNIIRF